MTRPAACRAPCPPAAALLAAIGLLSVCAVAGGLAFGGGGAGGGGAVLRRLLRPRLSPPLLFGPAAIFPTIEVPFPDGTVRRVSDSAPSRASFWRGLLTWPGHDAVFRVFAAYLGSGRYEAYLGFGEWIGPTALLAAPHVQRVFALEPDPLCRRQLLENVFVNPDAATKTVVSAACIAPRPGPRTLMGEGGSGSFLRGVASNATRAWEARVRPWAVDCVTLPSFLREHGIEPRRTFVKVDVEGGEWELLPALHGWLESLGAGGKPTLLISFHEIDGRAAAAAAVLPTLRLFAFGAVLESETDVTGHASGAGSSGGCGSGCGSGGAPARGPLETDLPLRAPAAALTVAALLAHDYLDVLVADQ